MTQFSTRDNLVWTVNGGESFERSSDYGINIVATGITEMGRGVYNGFSDCPREHAYAQR